MNEVGSGLALLICKNFAEMMGAEFIIESEKDKGSTFILNIAEK
jgi:signal transduction histidine kinase